MASFFNLTLDTTAPAGLTLKLNNGAAYATSTAVTATIGLTDSVTTGYQMKIWGVAGAATESEAAWATFAKSKAITLTTGDGQKTVSIKVRDDVGNETATVTAKITLDTAVPVVTITGPDKSQNKSIASERGEYRQHIRRNRRHRRHFRPSRQNLFWSALMEEVPLLPCRLYRRPHVRL
jgi:hypothetical protein